MPKQELVDRIVEMLKEMKTKGLADSGIHLNKKTGRYEGFQNLSNQKLSIMYKDVSKMYHDYLSFKKK